MTSSRVTIQYSLLCLVAIGWSSPVTAQLDSLDSSEAIPSSPTETTAADELDSRANEVEQASAPGDQRHSTGDSPLVKTVTAPSTDTLSILAVPTKRIREAIESAEYVLFPRSKLHQLSRMKDQHPEGSQLFVPAITRAEYSGVLYGDLLQNGTLQLQLNAAKTLDPHVLGRTNLQKLEFRQDGHLIPTASLTDGRLALLTVPQAALLEGSWSARGIRSSDGVQFELLLPPAAVTQVHLLTAGNFRVTSPNAVVQSETVGTQRRWTLFPRASQSISFLCERVADSIDSAVDSTLAVDTTLRVSEHTVFVEWTIVVPPELDDASVAVAVNHDCRITDVLSESGNRISWKLTGESDRELVISGLPAGRSVLVHGVSTARRDGALVLPLLTAAPQRLVNNTRIPVRFRSTGFRLVVNPKLAVMNLDLDGLYQQEVSFNSIGEQVIELRQFDDKVAATIHVEPSNAAIHQKLLINRPTATPGIVTVYAELEPRSDHQTYEIEWHISGPWRPTSVKELHSDLPVYSRIRASEDGTRQVLQIELRSVATSIQPARLSIEFRSTQAITPQTSLLPILVNDSFRSVGTWILSAATAPFPAVVQAKTVSDIEAELEDEFLWLIDDLQLPDSSRLQMTKTDRLWESADSSQTPKPAIPRATVDYQLLLTETQVTEDIQLRLTSADQLPESMILLFPEGIDVQLEEPSSTEQLSPTGRRTDNHWQEWLLAIPQTDPASSVFSVNLRVRRPIAGVDFAAFPRLPNTSDVSLTARSVTDTEAGFTPPALVSESSDDGESDSFILEPDIPVSISRTTNRFRLSFSRTNLPDRFLGIRGTAWIAVSLRTDGDRCQCLADLVVTRSGPVEFLTVQWSDASNIHVFVDDQRVSFPVSDSTTHILLPHDQTTTSVRILWMSPVARSGWINRVGKITLPHFDGVTNLNMVQFVQLPPGYDSAAPALPGFAAVSNADCHLPPQLTASNAAIGDFLTRWRLTEESGGISNSGFAEDGHVVVRIIFRRSLFSGTVLAFLSVIVVRRFLSGVRLRTMAALMLAVLLLAAFGTPVTAWLLFGLNSGLAVLLVLRTCWQPFADFFSRVVLSPDRQTDSTASAVATAIVALLLTGQAPSDSDSPPVLINEEAQTTSPFVFVRKDLLPAAARPTDFDVRVIDVVAHVRVEQGGGTEISVGATVASRRSDNTSRFTLPVESTTLTECSLDGIRVAPVRGPQGRPQVRISMPQIEAATNIASLAEWDQHRVNYTLRTDVTPVSGRLNIRVPLPFSVRSQLTLETIGDPILSARLSRSSTLSDEFGLVTFPVQYNRGPLDIIIVTQLSQSKISDTSRSVTVICRAETTENRTRLICRYQHTAEQPAPTELVLPRVPGFQAGTALGNDGNPLQLTSSEGLPVVQGNPQQLADFQMTWESPQERMTTNRLIPVAALEPPTGCRADRVLFAVQVSDPFEVRAAVLAGIRLNEVNLGDDERASFQLTSNDLVFAVEPRPGDIHLQLGMQATRRVALRMTQKLEVGVEQLAWSCRCDMKVTGPDTFRQRIRVPPELLIDRVDVSVEGASRLRSWSCRDGLLLVSFREGTGGNYRLSFNGIVPVPGNGRIQLLPVQLESTDVVDSTLVLYSKADATVQLENDGGSTLPPYPERLTIVDPSQPLILSTRIQHLTSACMVIVAHERTQHLKCDAVIRIQAGDQGWKGLIQLQDEYSEAEAEWIMDGSTTLESIERGELPARDLSSGQAATLVLRGVRIPANGTTLRIPLPILEPDVIIHRLQVFRRMRDSETAKSSDMQWMLNSVASVTAVPPPLGLVQLDQQENDDAQDSSIRVAAIQPVESSLSASPVHRTARSFSVTRLSPTHRLISATTDILIEFGEADETRCVIPRDVRILSCRLDGAELPEAVNPDVISIQREFPIQRLTIDWFIQTPNVGYLPHHHHLLTPSTEATEQEQFMMIHAPDDQLWSVGEDLIEITFTQLHARIAATFPESVTRGRPAVVTSSAAGFLSDLHKTPDPLERIYELTDPDGGYVTSRRRFPWPQWIPIMALAAACLGTASRRLFRKRSHEARRTSDSDATSQAERLPARQSDTTSSAPA